MYNKSLAIQILEAERQCNGYIMLEYIESVKRTMIWDITNLGIEAIVIGIATIYILVSDIDGCHFAQAESKTSRRKPRSVVDRLGESHKVEVIGHNIAIETSSSTQCAEKIIPY